MGTLLKDENNKQIENKHERGMERCRNGHAQVTAKARNLATIKDQPREGIAFEDDLQRRP